MATAASVSVLQARALKAKQRAKAEKKAKLLAKSKPSQPSTAIVTAETTIPLAEKKPEAKHEESREEDVGSNSDVDPSGSGSEREPQQSTALSGTSIPPTSYSTVAAPATFDSLGLIPPLLEALKQVGYTKPTDIQSGIIPHALEGKDVIGVAETVSTSGLELLTIRLTSGYSEYRGPERPLRLRCRSYRNYGTSQRAYSRVYLLQLGAWFLTDGFLFRT